MGRTNPTYRDTLAAVEKRWADYRRGLRRRDQPRLDRLFDHAREHADAAGLLNHPEPLWPALIGMALEQEARLDAQAERLARLEAAVEGRSPPDRDGDEAEPLERPS